MTKRNVELLLLCIAAPIVIILFAMMVIAESGTDYGIEALSFEALGVPIGIFVAFLIAHIAMRKLAPNADAALLPITFALCGIGIAFVTRLAPEVASRQLMWMFIGVAALILVMLLVRKVDVLANYKYTLMIVGVLLLVSPMLPGIGNEVNGSRLWLSIGPFSFQPGEIAKVCIVLFLGAYLSQNREMLSVFTWRVGPFHLPSIQTLLPLLVMWALAFLIVVFEKDLGSALVLFLMFLVMLYVATGKKLYVVTGLLLAAIGAVALYMMFDHVQTRVSIWMDPFADPQGSGYQLVQALYSFADGELFGVGIGRGLSDVIPYVESDFIFAAIAEETGLLGASAILLLYLLFSIRGMLVASRARSDFGSFVAVGLTSIVVLQAFIIVGGVTGLIPLTGITLPFVSQGGSSLLAGFIIVAFLMRISDESTGSKDELQMTSAALHSTGVLGRVALGKRITNSMIAFSILFALLVANLTYVMIVNAAEIKAMPGNNHTIQKEIDSERGMISTADGVVLAMSEKQPDGTYEREYPAGTLAAHIVGYYSAQYGLSGIEQTMNESLRGNKDFGNWTNVVNYFAGVTQPGNDVRLTIDSDVQQAAQDAIAGYKGACVAIDPKTGAVLAMASSPTYDAANYEQVIQGASSSGSDSSELLNRCTQALYAPGSTFKIVTLTAALEDGVAEESTMYESPASMDIGNADVTNFHNRDYGQISLRRAFELSSNTVFGQVGEELGATRLVDASKAFGFNKTFDFELPLAMSLMPEPSEMTTWETAWAAAGEPVGEHESPAGPQATVLEMALVGCGIANGGTIMEPYLVDGVFSANGARSYTASPSKLWQATSSGVAARVLNVMKGVVSSGTATDAALSGVTVAGKTGTAEHKGKADDSWFVGIADADGDCQVVVAIMLEEVGSTAHAAGLSTDVIRAALR